MPLREPAWWYAPDNSVVRRLLRPVSTVYGWVATRRMERAAPYRAAVPVICVGNFTVGGTGKTPLALHLSERLRVQGRRPAILTRGYGGRFAGPRWVALETDTAREVGDEALLLARAAPTLVARDRAAGARCIAAASAADVIVMDDGLQHPGLAKDLAIAVLDGRRGIGNGEVLPGGPLRAPLEVQLALADAIIVNHSGGSAAGGSASVAWLRQRFPGPVLAAAPRPSGDVAWLEGARIAAFAGIADPRRFFDLLTSLGAAVVERVAFPDHHRFTEPDAVRLLRLAEGGGLFLVTTEKDWVRLLGEGGARADLRGAARPIGIRLGFEDRDAGRLASLVTSAINRRGAG